MCIRDRFSADSVVYGLPDVSDEPLGTSASSNPKAAQILPSSKRRSFPGGVCRAVSHPLKGGRVVCEEPLRTGRG